MGWYYSFVGLLDLLVIFLYHFHYILWNFIFRGMFLRSTIHGGCSHSWRVLITSNTVLITQCCNNTVLIASNTVGLLFNTSTIGQWCPSVSIQFFMHLLKEDMWILGLIFIKIQMTALSKLSIF